MILLGFHDIRILSVNKIKVIGLKKQIQIKICPDGKIEAKTLGMQGQECTQYIKILEELLQAKTVESNYTDAYYQEQTQEVTKEQIPNKNR